MPKNSRDWLKSILLLAVIGVIAFVYFDRLAIIDFVKLAGYHPPSGISQLASDDTMTALGQHYFYLNHPEIDDKASFRQNCPNGTEQTVVLGCYHSGESGIFLLGVSDPRLAGVEQVTAAHEMLHAAYERLSTSERQQVDGWLLAYYKTVTDPQLLATFASYRKTEPGQVVNEMHSIFGTEVANLPGPLENYYKRYFTDRAKIVSYYTNYQASFSNLQQQIIVYDKQLAKLKSQIAEDEASATSENTSLGLERNQLSQEAASGNASDYNASVDSFNASVERYNALVEQIKSEINQYNQIVSARNQIAIAFDNLGKELNANAQTIPAASH